MNKFGLIKNCQKSRNRREISQLDKEQLQNVHSAVCFLHKIRNRAQVFSLTTPIQYLNGSSTLSITKMYTNC